MSTDALRAALVEFGKQLDVADSYAKRDNGDEPLPSVWQLQNGHLRALLARIDAALSGPPEGDGWLQVDALDARRYRRLRVLGCAPSNTPQLNERTVLCFTNLDKVVDDDMQVVPSRGEVRVPLPASPTQPTDALRAALMACGAQFRFYEQEHTKAGKHEKAATNKRCADLCDDVLAASPTDVDPCLSKREAGEPMFVLLARDIAAWHAVQFWADLWELEITDGVRPDTEEERHNVAVARARAETFHEWRKANRPLPVSPDQASAP